MMEVSPLMDILKKELSPDKIWEGAYKIPWDEPGFSRRMLQEHLSQEHDLASRKSEKISAQIQWLHSHIFEGETKRIFDLGCGPGLYLKGFCDLGHQCAGVDISPASVQYAREHLPETCPVEHGDVREVDFGGPYDVVSMIFGELNVFSPDACKDILERAYRALAPGGCLLLEIQIFEAVKRVGETPNSWYAAPSGLFSERPHVCLIENTWLEKEAIAMQFFHVIDLASGEMLQYRSTTKAWTEDAYVKLLSDIGFSTPTYHDDWPGQTEGLAFWTARK